MNPWQTSHCCLVSNHMSTEPHHAGQPPRSPPRGARAPTLTGKVRGPTLRRQQTAPEDGHWARWQDTQGVHSCGSTSSPQTSLPWGRSQDPAAHREPCPCSRGPHPAPFREDASHMVEDWTRASLEHEPKPDVPPAGLDEGQQHSFPSKEQVFFNFMAAVTICSDFRAPKNKVWHCFHCFPIYFP